MVLFHKPFCVDLHNDTFSIIHRLLESFGVEWQDPDSHLASGTSLFPSSQDQERFVSKVVDLLTCHFNVANMCNGGGNVAEKEKVQLEKILYRFVDLPRCPTSVIKLVSSCLNSGVNILLPCLTQRINKSTSLLSGAQSLTKGQELNLRLILRSLNDPSVVASLLQGEEDKAFKLVQILLFRVYNDHVSFH